MRLTSESLSSLPEHQNISESRRLRPVSSESEFVRRPRTHVSAKASRRLSSIDLQRHLHKLIVSFPVFRVRGDVSEDVS